MVAVSRCARDRRDRRDRQEFEKSIDRERGVLVCRCRFPRVASSLAVGFALGRARTQTEKECEYEQPILWVSDAPPDLGFSGVFVHPEHPDFPLTWMTRHYGLLAVGRPGVTPKTFPADKPVTCRYRLLFHRGALQAAEIQKAYEACGATIKLQQEGRK